MCSTWMHVHRYMLIQVPMRIGMATARNQTLLHQSWIQAAVDSREEHPLGRWRGEPGQALSLGPTGLWSGAGEETGAVNLRCWLWAPAGEGVLASARPGGPVFPSLRPRGVGAPPSGVGQAVVSKCQDRLYLVSYRLGTGRRGPSGPFKGTFDLARGPVRRFLRTPR